MTADAWFGLPEIPAISDLSLKDASDQLSVQLTVVRGRKSKDAAPHRSVVSVSGQFPVEIEI
jgi:hypothetical protein